MFNPPALSFSDLRTAYQEFDNGLNDQSCADCNSSEELMLLHAFTKTAMIFIDNNDVTKDSFLELAKQFGVTVTGDTFESIDANVSRPGGCYKIPTGAFDKASAIIPKLITDANTVIAELNSISDPNFKMILHPAQTGLADDLEVDYGEVLFLKGLVYAIRAQLEARQAYDLKIPISGKVATIINTGLCGQESGVNLYINSDLLNPNPNLLKVLPTSNYPHTDGAAMLLQSRKDLIASIDYYFETLSYLRSESTLPGNHLLYIDANDSAEMADVNDVNNILTTVRYSLEHDTVGTYNIDGTTVRVDLNPVFGNDGNSIGRRYPNPVSPRNLLPLFNSNNKPVGGTFGHGLGNDATLGGILPDVTQQDWISWLRLSAPDLTGAFGVVVLPNPIVPGDKGKAPVIVTNSGDATAVGKMSIEIYASLDTALDSGDILVGTLANQSISIVPGASKTFVVNLTIPNNVPQGAYYLIAKINSTHTIAESNEENNTAVTDGPGNVVWQCGSFGGRTNVKLAVKDSDGNNVTFSLTGGGWAEIVGGANFDQLVLHNTSAKSQLQIITTGKNAKTSIGDIIVGDNSDANGINGIAAKTTSLRGNITIHGGLGLLQLDDVASNHTITIGGIPSANSGVLMKFDRVRDLVINSQIPIKVLTATEWLDTDANEDKITAPSIGTLQITGDKKRNLAGNFEASLNLDGSVQQQKATLVNAKIAGDVSGHNWSIRGGDLKTLQAGSWIDSNMVVDGNTASIKLNKLHGDINIGGNAANISIAEPMALSAPESGEIGRLNVSGKATIKAGKDTIKFTNGSSLLHNSGTLYTSEPNMYRLEDLRMYNHLGANWSYYSSYKITGSGGNDSNTVNGTVSVRSALQGGSYIVDSSITDNFKDKVTVSTGWHTDVNGGTYLTSLDANDSLGYFGDMQSTGDVGLIGVEFLRLGQQYKYSGPLSGHWYNLPINLHGATVDAVIDNATIATSCKLIGHEQVSVGTGTDNYLAAKVAISIAVKGTGHFTYNSVPYDGTFTANQTQTIWCVPAVGIVKAASSMSVGGHGGGGGVSYKIVETDLLK